MKGMGRTGYRGMVNFVRRDNDTVVVLRKCQTVHGCALNK